MSSATRAIERRAARPAAVLAALCLAAAPSAAQDTTAAATPGGPQQAQVQAEADADHGESRITNEYIPLALEGFPNRPKPIIEIGPEFLGTNRIARGFQIPGGAVWRPSFLVFGEFRTGISVVDNERTKTTQWANRLDLFGNLYLTATERFVIGFRPFDETENGNRFFSGYTSTSPGSGAFDNRANFDFDTVSHLFFEGDIGELFPAIDLRDSKGLDVGFSVGRQPINFQEGLLINDFIDAVGITQTNFKPSGSVNLRMTGLFAWNQINRNTPSANALLRNSEANRSQLVALFNELDTRAMTMQFDVIYVRSDEFRDSNDVTMPAGDGIYAGVGFVGRPGSGAFNLSLRFLTSIPVGDDVSELTTLPLGNPAARGSLLFSEVSWTPHHSQNFYYTNGFYAIDNYRAAALDPTVPGPLARAGVLFAGPGLGNFPGALSPTANEVVGGAFGHQMFFRQTRQQLLLEAAGRYSTAECAGPTIVCDPRSLAGGARFQSAIGRRWVFVLDGYVARDSLRGTEGAAFERDFGRTARTRFAARTELITRF